MLHIAWIEKIEDEPDSVATVTIWDHLEHRIGILDEQISPLPNGGTGDIVERATELLQKGGYRVHSVEPAPGGYAAIVETTPG